MTVAAGFAPQHGIPTQSAESGFGRKYETVVYRGTIQPQRYIVLLLDTDTELDQFARKDTELRERIESGDTAYCKVYGGDLVPD